MPPNNIGFVGCGHITTTALAPQAAALADDYRCRAFADIDAARSAGACAKFSGAYHATDVTRLLEDDDLDAVAICTLPDTHAELACEFLARGKHVLIQKPAAITYDQCRRLVAAERRSSARAMVAYCYRLSPLVRQIAETIAQPRLIYLRMMSRDLAASHAHYLANPALAGGGPLLELACHNVDLACVLARSEPVRVRATGGNMGHPGVDVIDNFVMTVEFVNGAVASLLSGDCGGADFARKWYSEVFGDGVTAIIDGFRRLIFAGKRSETIDYDYNVGIGLDRDMAVFRDVVLGRSPSPASAAEGVVATLLMLKAYDSLHSDRIETIELAEYLS